MKRKLYIFLLAVTLPIWAIPYMLWGIASEVYDNLHRRPFR